MTTQGAAQVDAGDTHTNYAKAWTAADGRHISRTPWT